MMLHINTDTIQKVLGITKEELMERLVKDAIVLQKECDKILHEREVVERKNNPEYAVYVKTFLNNYEFLNKYFTEEEIVNTCAEYMGVNDLTEEYVDRYAKDQLHGSAILLKKEVRKVKRLHGRGSRSGAMDNVMCSIFAVKNRYQTVRGGSDVTKSLLLQKCSYLKDYKINVYDINAHNDWIYVEINNQSLYVPFVALMEQDVIKIITTHLRYWETYLHNNEKYQKQIEFVNSKDVQEFLNKVSGNYYLDE